MDRLIKTSSISYPHHSLVVMDDGSIATSSIISNTSQIEYDTETNEWLPQYSGFEQQLPHVPHNPLPQLPHHIHSSVTRTRFVPKIPQFPQEEFQQNKWQIQVSNRLS